LQFFKTPPAGEASGRHFERCSTWQNDT